MNELSFICMGYIENIHWKELSLFSYATILVQQDNFKINTHNNYHLNYAFKKTKLGFSKFFKRMLYWSFICCKTYFFNNVRIFFSVYKYSSINRIWGKRLSNKFTSIFFSLCALTKILRFGGFFFFWLNELFTCTMETTRKSEFDIFLFQIYLVMCKE